VLDFSGIYSGSPKGQFHRIEEQNFSQESTVPKANLARSAFSLALNGVNAVRRGRKCDFCRQTGVSGRKAIFEALIVDDEVRVAIQEQLPAIQLRWILEGKGETTLFEKAVREAAAGTISLEEACKFREVGATDRCKDKRRE
jgi:type II secretory ATPase GspE/PulE/Tfp pilus assembly ATPase PilB-like protein